MIRGKCPNCKEALGHVDTDAITVGNRIVGPKYRGISYLCPMCFELLGVAIDPIALKAEIVAEVLDGLAAKAKKK